MPEPDVAVSVDPPEPVSGDLVTFTVTLRNRPLSELIFFTLGTEGAVTYGTGDQLRVDCASNDRSPVVETARFTQRLRRVGFHRHFILFQDCNQNAGPSHPPETLATIEFDMSGPAAPGNGPEPPTMPAPLGGSAPDRPMTIEPILQGSDHDGIVDHFTIDWGDGSPVEGVNAQLEQGTPACDPDSEYFSTFGSAQPEHTYSAAGSYVLTVNVVSVDCSGGTEQHATTTETITVSATSQQSSSS